jgi:hypothetical protein
MKKDISDELPARIEYHIVAALRGAIISGNYKVGETQIQVSYPTHVNIAPGGPLLLPTGLSTMFIVQWNDITGKTVTRLRLAGIEHFEPFHFALGQINELLLAFKLVRIGHINGLEIRTIGEADCIFRAPFINGLHTGDLNTMIKTPGFPNPWRFANAKHPDDPLGTTALALPHIGQPTFPIGRKFARCFDLFDHGYYNEALVISFSILDDQIQIALNTLLEARGLTSEQERNQFLRSIKEQRLKTFLGAVLKVLAGKSISEMWGDGGAALNWLNDERNEAMHGGYHASRRSAAFAIFTSMKLLVVLGRNEILELGLPDGMYRSARLLAAWQESPPKWVPRSEDIENVND